MIEWVQSKFSQAEPFELAAQSDKWALQAAKVIVPADPTICEHARSIQDVPVIQ